MKLERFKDIQIKELLQWAAELDEILTPDQLNPTKIKEFPVTIETSERLKRICKWKAEDLEEKLQKIEDIVMDSIEHAEYVFKHDRGGMPVMKKKYATADKRSRELRFRLGQDEDYTELKLEAQQWNIMYRDWVSHVNRLRRDFRLLEVEYDANGGYHH